MINNEATFIFDMWELVKDYMPEKIADKKKIEFLFSFFKILEDNDIYISDIKDSLHGEDKYIDAALQDFLIDEEDNDVDYGDDDE